MWGAEEVREKQLGVPYPSVCVHGAASAREPVAAGLLSAVAAAAAGLRGPSGTHTPGRTGSCDYLAVSLLPA